MSRKAFIIGHGLLRLRMQAYFWSSLNYLGSYRLSQQRELQAPLLDVRLESLLHFVKEELCGQKSYDIAYTYKNIVFIRHVITFTLDTNLFIPRKRKKSLLTTDGSQTRPLYLRNESKRRNRNPRGLLCYDLKQSKIDSK